MKMQDIIKEKDLKEEDCSVCKVHEKAYEDIPDGITCPSCGYVETNYFGLDEFTVVGEGNTYRKDHNINKYAVEQCTKCGGHIALIPEMVIYNGNHDIYYTGGRMYLNDDDEEKIISKIKGKITASVNQWKTRYDKGEDLKEWNLVLWIERDIAGPIAEYLHEKGLKK